MRETNIEFYKNINLQKFKDIAQSTGFETGIDIDVIYPYLENKEAIAELGMGYGRAIKCLIKKGFTGKIYGVDRIESFITHVKENVQADNLVTLNQDIQHLDLPEKVDAILWLWSGILELSLEEQRETIKNLKGFLKKDGKLFIEAPYDKIKVVGKKVDKHYIRVEMEWGTLEAYMPYEEDMERASRYASYANFEVIKYQTSTLLERVFYVFTS